VTLHAVFWVAFAALYLVVFVVDMWFTTHRSTGIGTRSALRWTGLWVALALLYGLAIYLYYPQNQGSATHTAGVVALKFLSGYLTEYSLSVDNLFVFIMIFSLMGVHEKNQPHLLKLGILLSIALRILFIVVGMGLIDRFHALIYVFGAVLIWTAWKMAFTNAGEHVDPKTNILHRLASRVFPVDPDPHASHFFRRIDGRVHITTVLLVFLVIGSTDVLFAIDSIPAVIGVIKEGTAGALTLGEENFIAITSNVFAVMGLVSLFFALKGVMKLFRYLQHGVSFILLFIGAKMLLSAWPPVSAASQRYPWVPLAVIVSTLVLAVLLSVVLEEAEERRDLTDLEE
jgi:tellurite resistance protein TerC